jgi:hypothetical protein
MYTQQLPEGPMQDRGGDLPAPKLHNIIRGSLPYTTRTYTRKARQRMWRSGRGCTASCTWAVSWVGYAGIKTILIPQPSLLLKVETVQGVIRAGQ